MTLDPEHVFLTNLHEATIKPKVDGKIDKNKQMCVWGSLEIHTKQSQSQSCSDYLRTCFSALIQPLLNCGHFMAH